MWKKVKSVFAWLGLVLTIAGLFVLIGWKYVKGFFIRDSLASSDSKRSDRSRVDRDIERIRDSNGRIETGLGDIETGVDRIESGIGRLEQTNNRLRNFIRKLQERNKRDNK